MQVADGTKAETTKEMFRDHVGNYMNTQDTYYNSKMK